MRKFLLDGQKNLQKKKKEQRTMKVKIKEKKA